MHHTIPRPTAARDIATWAEREELACVGVALARARQHLLPLVRREEV